MRYVTQCLFVLYLGASLTVGAQTLSTKETKVVLAVSSKTGSVTHIVLFHTFENLKKEEVFKKYTDHKFYVGLLKGRYGINKDVIVPQENTTIIMYTEKQVFPEESFPRADSLLPGDRFHLGNTKAEVVSSKEGELVLKT